MYDVGMEDLNDGLYPEAISGFTDLKTKYPYSKYAALADLRIADTHFERGKFVEAIDAYRTFLKFHPNHSEAPYAMFRIGEANYEQIPTNWWFLPPGAEKDQGSTKLAITAYRDMLARYPDADAASDARKRLDECRRKLADHELYVARFYYDRDRYKAASGRAEFLLKNYSGLGLDSEALLLVARSKRALNDYDGARDAATKLKTEHPESGEASKAEALLDGLPPPAKPQPGQVQPPEQGK